MTPNLPQRHDDLCNFASNAAEFINNNYICTASYDFLSLSSDIFKTDGNLL